MAKSTGILILHVSLADVMPPVWRRIVLDADITLRQLHHILQAAFGWTTSHLHQFEIDGERYAMADDELPFGMMGQPGHGPLDDRKAKLGRLVRAGQQFIYLYDFGDSWTHTIRVEDVEEAFEAMGYAAVVDGDGACPPEDVGGAAAYSDFLDTIQNRPHSQEARDMLDWAGGKFNPDLFDKRAANAALLRMASNGWGKK